MIRILMISPNFQLLNSGKDLDMTPRFCNILMKHCPDDVQVGAAYTAAEGEEVKEGAPVFDGIRRYPLHSRMNLGASLKEWKSAREALLAAVKDFQPDLVLCFGSEHPYGMIAEDLDIPVVIDMMGFLNVYHPLIDMAVGRNEEIEQPPPQPPAEQAGHRDHDRRRDLFSAFMKKAKCFLKRKAEKEMKEEEKNPDSKLLRRREEEESPDSKLVRRREEEESPDPKPVRMNVNDIANAIERRVMKDNSYFLVHTDWDRDLVRFYSPGSKIYHMYEPMRQNYYEEAGSWKRKKKDRLQLLTVSSADQRKGNEIILRTAWLLKNLLGLDFIWKVVGHKEFFPQFERKTGISRTHVNIELTGILSAREIVHELQEADFFIHPSIIDNCPNALVEAQLIGCPVIASNVGGVHNLVEDKVTGFLYPYNEPHTLAFLIADLYQSGDLLTRISAQEAEMARRRNDPEAIAQKLCRDLHSIVKDHKNGKSE